MSPLPASSKPSVPRLRLAALGLCVLLVAGCGGAGFQPHPTNALFSITPGTASIDTNCTGCNQATPRGGGVLQFSARNTDGSRAAVHWSLTAGDPTSGTGSITASGQYTPPSYLTRDSAEVRVTATLDADPTQIATALLTITPGFLQPISPENAALPAAGSLNLTGYLALAGGTTSIHFVLANTANGDGGGLGSLSAPNCRRDAKLFTSCTVTYTAPAVLSDGTPTYLVAYVGGTNARASAALLLNTAGIVSNPTTHQSRNAFALGSSGGNNNDYDASGNQIVDCCGGTLGALVEDSQHRRYLLSNNHLLARSDHATAGDKIVQPGLIDNNCTPFSATSSTAAPVAQLTAWLPLSVSSTNADAALALLTSNSPDGSILELGPRQPDGSLAAAPPGVSSTGGLGQNPALLQSVVKSGRTTGLTCGSVTALDLDVEVDYFLDCGETKPYLTKTFTGQIGVSGNAFSDAGDSGSLILDAATAEPVGLYFAGGTDAAGVSQGVATPAPDLLRQLSEQLGAGSDFRFVGAADHSVRCLGFGDDSLLAAQARPLSEAEAARARQAVAAARSLVVPGSGILGAAPGKSADHPGQAAVLLYLEPRSKALIPNRIDGVRTVMVPASIRDVAFGTAPQNLLQALGAVPLPAPDAASLQQAREAKHSLGADFLLRNPAFFAVGVGQSLDDPCQAALLVYVDRRRIPADLPPTLGGVRVRYLFLDRLHVTRSYAAASAHPSRCQSISTNSK